MHKYQNKINFVDFYTHSSRTLHSLTSVTLPAPWCTRLSRCSSWNWQRIPHGPFPLRVLLISFMNGQQVDLSAACCSSASCACLRCLSLPSTAVSSLTPPLPAAPACYPCLLPLLFLPPVPPLPSLSPLAACYLCVSVSSCDLSLSFVSLFLALSLCLFPVCRSVEIPPTAVCTGN